MEKPVPTYEEDDIDLYDLFRAVRKRSGLIAGIVVASVIVVAIVSFFTPPVYRGTALIRTTVISVFETEKMITGLEDLRKERRLDELSERLGISVERLAGLASLKIKPVKSDDSIVEITMYVNDPLLIKDLTMGVLRFLNGIAFVSKRLNMTKESLGSLAVEIKSKIGGMEDIKNSISAKVRQSRLDNLGFNPLEMESELINLKSRLKSVEDELSLINGFEVAVDPITPKTPVKPRKVMNMALAGAVSMFAGVILAIFMEWKEKRKGK